MWFLQKAYSNLNIIWRKKILTKFPPDSVSLNYLAPPKPMDMGSERQVFSLHWYRIQCSAAAITLIRAIAQGLLCSISADVLDELPSGNGLCDWTVMSQRFAALELSHHCLMNLEWIVHCQDPHWKHSPVNSRIPPHTFYFNFLLYEKWLETQIWPWGVARWMKISWNQWIWINS